MTVSKLISVVLITFGIIIMIYNIIKYFTLAKQLMNLKGAVSRYPKGILLFYFVLLVFFLIGYIAIDFSLFLPSFSPSNFLIALILFFGSVFVLIGVFLQLSLTVTIQSSNLEITQTLVGVVEARDKNLNGHSVHVSRLSMLIYNHLPRTRQRDINKTELEYAALLHDIGKLGIPESILNKDGALTTEEWVSMREHPVIGKRILSSLKSFGEISDWVLYHHERCDGKGYLKLEGENIPFPSRIIAVADTFSALTMNRSYRASKSYEEAVKILEKECRDTQLSGEVLDVFLAIPKQEVEQCKPCMDYAVDLYL